MNSLLNNKQSCNSSTCCLHRKPWYTVLVSLPSTHVVSRFTCFTFTFCHTNANCFLHPIIQKLTLRVIMLRQRPELSKRTPVKTLQSFLWHRKQLAPVRTPC